MSDPSFWFTDAAPTKAAEHLIGRTSLATCHGIVPIAFFGNRLRVDVNPDFRFSSGEQVLVDLLACMSTSRPRDLRVRHLPAPAASRWAALDQDTRTVAYEALGLAIGCLNPVADVEAAP